jgi:glycosyltransferase involved in cell wall biosynthesis
MSARNKLTVGMPVYNDPSGLLRSVPTVFNQTWDGEIRLLIVDDGSNDETPEVIVSLQDIYPGIEAIRNDDNRGRPFARNQVLDHVDSPYLAWLDAGDLWHPRKLEVQFETLARAQQEHSEPLLCTTTFRWVFADSAQERIKVPDVSGDQLYNALTSTLPPYLWTLLGDTSAFRSAGRFDERLPRRQDYEYFVRFIERGGRVVATPQDLPLATYMNSDVGRSPAEVATSNKVIRQIHQPLYARYGRRFARKMRRKQLALEARFYDNNGRRARAAAYRALGWLWAPYLPSPCAIRRRLSRRARRAIAAAGRLMVRVMRPALPLLRRIGVTSLIRKVANPEGIMPAYYAELEKWSPTAAEEAEKLESEIEADGGSASADTWLRLEKAYRQGGLLTSAHSALERGQHQHPGSTDLKTRVIELLALRRRFLECVDMWTSLSPAEVERATAITYYRVGWVYRQLNDSEESLRVLEAGLNRWPGDRFLLAQLYKSRARTTDWNRALKREKASSEATAPGLVTDLGFLSGEDQPVRGWVTADYTEDPTVLLMVNGLAVTSTSAAKTPEGYLSFSFKCTGLMEYLGDGDIVSFEFQGQPLPIEGGGNRLVFRPGHRSRFTELRERLAHGFVFENLGWFVEGNTPRRKKATLALYDEIRALIEEEEGYQIYPMYGNLLGAIRDNDFIPHDVGGFDVAYVSRYQRARTVREEFTSICRMLVDHGYHLKLMPWSAYVRPQRSSDEFVDLNFAWFNKEGELNLSFGWRTTPVTDPGLLAFPREAPLGSHWVPVPGNAEAVLTQIYGPTWITPNQGYSPEDELKRDHAFLLTPDDMEALRSHSPDLVEVAPEDASEGS